MKIIEPSAQLIDDINAKSQQIFLRPYQQAFIDNIRNEFQHGHKRVVGVAPCGAGKTIMTGWMIREALRRGKKSVFFVHRKELIEQTSKTFTALGIPHGIIAAGIKPQYNIPVQIASVQTLIRRFDFVPTTDFLICDECHHILANSYTQILEKYPDAYLLGVTATPMRTGGITLADVFQSMVQSLSVNKLIELGNLTRFSYFAQDCGADLRGVKVKFGEYDNQQLQNAMSGQKVIKNITENYLMFAGDKNAICYCVNVEHSQFVAQQFREAGIRAAHVDGETPKDERAYIVEQFRRGDIQVLCNAELFGEGFDVPNCHAVILARPTKSLTLYIQQSMRAMRPDPNNPNKVAVILDCVENYKRHGYPNTEHNWSLLPNEEKESGVAPTKICPECGNEVLLSVHFCPACNHEFQSEEIPATEDILSKQDVSFQPVDKKNSFTKPEEFMEIAKQTNRKIGWVAFRSLEYVTSYEDCLHIARFCGYKDGWAWHKWQELKNNIRA